MNVAKVTKRAITVHHDGADYAVPLKAWSHPERLAGVPEAGRSVTLLSADFAGLHFAIPLNHEPLNQYAFVAASAGDAKATKALRTLVEDAGLPWHLDKEGNPPPAFVFAEYVAPPEAEAEPGVSAEEEAIIARAMAEIRALRAQSGEG